MPANKTAKLLTQATQGDARAEVELTRTIYDELRSIAATYVDSSRARYSLRPTDIVNEAFRKILSAGKSDWISRKHYLSYAAKAMRSVLRDYENKGRSEKHGGKYKRIVLRDLTQIPDDETVDISDLEDALEKLRKEDDNAYQIVVMRFLGGMTIPETATVLNSTESEIKKTWRFARVWLLGELMVNEDRGKT